MEIHKLKCGLKNPHKNAQILVLRVGTRCKSLCLKVQVLFRPFRLVILSCEAVVAPCQCVQLVCLKFVFYVVNTKSVYFHKISIPPPWSQ